MKKTKVIIPALGILLLSTAASVTGTVAWFSANSTVSASGMAIKAKTTESLVINDTAVVTTATSVTFAAFDTALTPINFNEGSYRYVAAGANIDPATGLAKTGETIQYKEVTGATTDGLAMYKDYIVYIAAAGQKIDGGVLQATVTFGTAELTQLAATVDFKVLAETGEDVAPAHNVGRDGTVNAANPQVVELPAANFPLNTTNKSIPVLMRTYFDGELKDADNKCYVRSEAVKLDSLSISVSFTLKAGD